MPCFRHPILQPHRDDVLLAVTGLLAGLLLWSLGLHTQGNRLLLPGWATLVPLCTVSALELVRRSAPQSALAGGVLAVIGDQFTQGSLATVVIFADLVYAAVVYGTPRAARRIPITTGLVSLALTVGFLAWFREPEALLIGMVAGLISFAPALTGSILRNHREAAVAARLRAEQTALLAEMDRAQAVTAERARMARELHDMVANHLSAIAIHSTAALSLDTPDASTRALSVIRENSVQGLAEMRRLIGLLRESEGSGEPSAAPSLDGLDALLETSRASGAGSGLTFTLADDRPAGLGLPAPVELAAYRIVQESLTNALKHASPGPVAVRLSYADSTLHVAVTSAFGGGRAGPRAPGSGAGLVGMRERVTLLDGELEAGPVTLDDGTKTWQVRALLPAEDENEELPT
ncbi:sensor histidine kinase [Streptomyces candidus]|uniref:histidine kinase n=1 Tax=Streptomyces candidus TaxID=67283 RepID=A0A7X0HK24_9ACTN|nr:histidine kinase [Streptomyces candidus]MBB6437603.1 signal transduction histidine kinase [Streptomyces candidus]GHH53654.1 two-component sensor histidine kinase [Streptomyces candidus]